MTSTPRPGPAWPRRPPPTDPERRTLTVLMLETEADLLRTLRSGTYTLAELYALCETAVDVSPG